MIFHDPQTLTILISIFFAVAAASVAFAASRAHRRCETRRLRRHNRRVSTTAFVNGAVFDGHHHLGAATVLVEDGAIVAVGDLDAPAGARVVDVAGGLVAPGFVDAHVHAVQGGLERNRCDLSAGETREDYLTLIKAYAEHPPRRPLDPRRRLGDGCLPGRYAARGRPGHRSSPTDRCSCPTATTTAPGSTPGRSSWPASRASHRSRRTGAIERDPDGHPTGTLHEGAMRAGLPTAPGDLGRRTTTTDCSRARPTCTRSASPGGRTRSWAPTPAWTTPGRRTCTRRSAATSPPTSSARSGGTASAVTSRSRRWSSGGEEYTHGRFRATSVKVMQDGVAENGTAALTSPYLDRCGHATDNSGHSFVDPIALRRYVARLDAEGFQVHVHGDRRPRCAGGARRVRAGPTRPGDTTSRTSSWSTPTTYAASASSGSPRTSRPSGPAWTTRWST